MNPNSHIGKFLLIWIEFLCPVAKVKAYRAEELRPIFKNPLSILQIVEYHNEKPFSSKLEINVTFQFPLSIDSGYQIMLSGPKP
jgi:hypothetical protein